MYIGHCSTTYYWYFDIKLQLKMGRHPLLIFITFPILALSNLYRTFVLRKARFCTRYTQYLFFIGLLAKSGEIKLLYNHQNSKKNRLKLDNIDFWEIFLCQVYSLSEFFPEIYWKEIAEEIILITYRTDHNRFSSAFKIKNKKKKK